MNSDNVLEKIPSLKANFESLQREHNITLSAYYDATRGGYIGKGWMTNYALLGLTISLPEGTTKILKDTYDQNIELFKKVHEELAREKTFYYIEFQAQNKSKQYSVMCFMENSYLYDEKHSLLYNTSEFLFRLSQSDLNFNSMYHSERSAFISYSLQKQRILAVPLRTRLDFRDHLIVGNREIFLDEYSNNHLAASGSFLGNSHFFDGSNEKAIEEWLFSIKFEVHPDILYNLACAYSKLGKMEDAYEYCKRAVNENVSRDLLFYDADLSEFRKHPLYQEIVRLYERKQNP